MRVAVRADHAGTPLNRLAIAELRRIGMSFSTRADMAPRSRTIYPDFTAVVGKEVTSGRCERGLLICVDGVGVAVAANKGFRHLCRNVPRHLFGPPRS